MDEMARERSDSGLTQSALALLLLVATLFVLPFAIAALFSVGPFVIIAFVILAFWAYANNK
jgi:Flp pilus assembly protein TadB